jgi:soluble lytic murein transglycosylase-like protein
MTPAQTLLFLTLASPAPEIHGIPGLAISYQPVVDYWADVNLVPRFLARKLVKRESQWDNEAQSYEWKQKRNGTWYRTEKVIAQGLCQITANEDDRRELVEKAGMNPDKFDWRNPGHSARVGMAFLGRLLVRFNGELRPSVAGYNAGMYGASQWWEGRWSLPVETRKYLKEILG